MSYDIGPFYGTHADQLSAELGKLPPGALVVEHGVGVYSTPLISRYDVRVLAVEPLPGWVSWASWLYKLAGREMSSVERSKNTLNVLADAALVFVDGVARDRGPLLGWAIERRVPVIIAHDTEEDALDSYLYTRAHFKAPAYDVEHHGDHPRTTVWRLK
jgi:hypothetical protein